MKSNSIDMVKGPLFKNILFFSIPLMLSSLLQILFNAADVVVVGKFAGSQALAAVGGCSSVVFLITSLLNGLSVGSNVVVAKYCGKKDIERIDQSIHTSLWIGFYGGLLFTVVGFFASRTFLELMSTPSDVIDLADLYMKIYFIGTIAMVIYNFGAAILRSKGDTKRPLYFLAIAGIINVVLNLIFVIIFKMSVAGVALATIISQIVSAILIIITLLNEEYPMRFEFKKMHLNKEMALEIMKIGIPAGVQGIVFSFSNIVIQSSVNSFGSVIMAANSAANNIEGFVYIGMNAFFQACMTFTGQNVGAKNKQRINQVILACLLLDLIVGTASGILVNVLADPLLGIYSSDPLVIEYGKYRLFYVCLFYVFNGFLDVIVGSLRGMGHSSFPTLITVVGICGIRLFWLWVVFPMYPTLQNVYISFPISWIITALFQAIYWIYVRRKLVL